MKNLVIFIFCIFLYGNAYSETDLQKGCGDTIFVRDIKNIEQTVLCDSDGYKSEPTTVNFIAYKVIDTIFIDSVVYNKIPNSLIVEALMSRDTVFGEEETWIWYQREKEWFSKKHTKTSQPILFFNEKTKTVFYDESVVFLEKKVLWKTIVMIFFFLVACLGVFFLGRKEDFYKWITKENSAKLIGFIFIAALVGITYNVIAGLPMVFLFVHFNDNSWIEGYDAVFWWQRAGLLMICFILGAVVSSLFKSKKKENLKTEKPDSNPDEVAGAE